MSYIIQQGAGILAPLISLNIYWLYPVRNVKYILSWKYTLGFISHIDLPAKIHLPGGITVPISQ